VRKARSGEAPGHYFEQDDGNLQILGYSVLLPEDIEELIHLAFNLFCSGDLRKKYRVMSYSNHSKIGIGSDGNSYISNKLANGKWSRWKLAKVVPV
jgi:hypothetical protein